MTSVPVTALTGMLASLGNSQSRIVERPFSCSLPPGFQIGVDGDHRSQASEKVGTVRTARSAVPSNRGEMPLSGDSA